MSQLNTLQPPATGDDLDSVVRSLVSGAPQSPAATASSPRPVADGGYDLDAVVAGLVSGKPVAAAPVPPSRLGMSDLDVLRDRRVEIMRDLQREDEARVSSAAERMRGKGVDDPRALDLERERLARSRVARANMALDDLGMESPEAVQARREAGEAVQDASLGSKTLSIASARATQKAADVGKALTGRAGQRSNFDVIAEGAVEGSNNAQWLVGTLAGEALDPLTVGVALVFAPLAAASVGLKATTAASRVLSASGVAAAEGAVTGGVIGYGETGTASGAVKQAIFDAALGGVLVGGLVGGAEGVGRAVKAARTRRPRPYEADNVIEPEAPEAPSGPIELNETGEPFREPMPASWEIALETGPQPPRQPRPLDAVGVGEEVASAGRSRAGFEAMEEPVVPTGAERFSARQDRQRVKAFAEQVKREPDQSRVAFEAFANARQTLDEANMEFELTGKDPLAADAGLRETIEAYAESPGAAFRQMYGTKAPQELTTSEGLQSVAQRPLRLVPEPDVVEQPTMRPVRERVAARGGVMEVDPNLPGTQMRTDMPPNEPEPQLGTPRPVGVSGGRQMREEARIAAEVRQRFESGGGAVRAPISSIVPSVEQTAKPRIIGQLKPPRIRGPRVVGFEPVDTKPDGSPFFVNFDDAQTQIPDVVVTPDGMRTMGDVEIEIGKDGVAVAEGGRPVSFALEVSDPITGRSYLVKDRRITPHQQMMLYSGIPMDAVWDATIKMLKPVGKAAKTHFDYIARPTFDRIRDMSPKTAYAVRRFFKDKNFRAGEYHERGADFVKAMSKLPRNMREEIGSALSSGDYKTAADIVRGRVTDAKIRQQAMKGLSDVKRLLNDTIPKQARESGIVFNQIAGENYFPRLVRDYAKLKAAMGSEFSGVFDQAASRYAEKVGKRASDLTVDELAESIDGMLRGEFGFLEIPSNFKQRIAEVVDAKTFGEFYEPPAVALTRYLTNMAHNIELARNFGPKSIAGDFTSGRIPRIVAAEIKAGKIRAEDQFELKNSLLTLAARDGVGNSFLNAWLKASYVSLLADVASAVVQFADVGLSMLRNGFKPTSRAIFEELFDRGADGRLVSHRDYHIERLSEDFPTGQGTSRRVLDWMFQGELDNQFSAPIKDKISDILSTEGMFKYSGFRSIDRFGKNVNLNAARHSAQRAARANKNSTARIKLENELRQMFPEQADFDRALQDIVAGRNGFEAMTLYFNRLADVQPITKAELPPAYNEIATRYSPSVAKLLYALNSFVIRQLGQVRTRIADDLVAGSAMIREDNTLRAAKHRYAAAANLVKGITALTAMNVGVNYAMDWMTRGVSGIINGEEPDPMDAELQDYLIEGGLQIIGLHPFQVQRIMESASGERGIADTAVNMTGIGAVVRPIEDVLVSGRAMVSPDPNNPRQDVRFIRNAPILGKMADAYFGEGIERFRDQFYRERTRKRDELYESITDYGNVDRLTEQYDDWLTAHREMHVAAREWTLGELAKGTPKARIVSELSRRGYRSNEAVDELLNGQYEPPIIDRGRANEMMRRYERKYGEDPARLREIAMRLKLLSQYAPE